MICAVSTAENSNIPQSQFFPMCQKLCVAVAVVAVASSGAVFNAQLQKQYLKAYHDTYYSTDIVSNVEYDSRGLNLWWDGDSVMCSDKANNLLCLLEIQQLQNNWNGNGANSFSQDLLARARRIVMTSFIQASIFPTARDSIQFEYENDIGDYLEIEVFESGRIKAFSYSHDGQPLSRDISLGDINEVVNRFYGRDI